MFDTVAHSSNFYLTMAQSISVQANQIKELTKKNAALEQEVQNLKKQSYESAQSSVYQQPLTTFSTTPTINQNKQEIGQHQPMQHITQKK